MWRGRAVVRGKRLMGPYCELDLYVPRMASEAQPGQFAHIQCPPVAGEQRGMMTGPPLLRRPLSLAGADPVLGTVRLVFRVKGAGTAGLAAAELGSSLDVLGPLGRGVFPVPEGDVPGSGVPGGDVPGSGVPGAGVSAKPAAGSRGSREPAADLGGSHPAIAVAGGIGLGPLLFLAERYASWARPFRLLLGLKGAADLPLAELAKRVLPLGMVDVSTEKGLPGTTQGMVTVLLEQALRSSVKVAPGEAGRAGSGRPGASGQARRPGERLPDIYACGPRPMLAAVVRQAWASGLRVWVSMEERLACGVGACRGCAVPVTGDTGWSGYKLVCRDGPVFRAGEIAWDSLPGGEAAREQGKRVTRCPGR